MKAHIINNNYCTHKLIICKPTQQTKYATLSFKKKIDIKAMITVSNQTTELVSIIVNRNK